MHSNPHNNHLINHLFLIVGANGPWYGAAVHAPTINLIEIYELHVDEYVYICLLRVEFPTLRLFFFSLIKTFITPQRPLAPD